MEFELIQKLQSVFPNEYRSLSGFRDDAASLPRIKSNETSVWSSDVIVEGVDFVLTKMTPEQVGRKALAVNLSDLAAMGARPMGFQVSLGIPKKYENRHAWLAKLYNGMLSLCRRYDVVCYGGDVSAAKELFIAISILGVCSNKPVSRSTVKKGDWIGVTGSLGATIKKHHFSFEPRLSEGQYLAKRKLVNAMMDVSDGLIQDLGHLSRLSKTGIEINLEQIPISNRVPKSLSRESRIKKALTDGEDFELLLSASSSQKKRIESNWSRHFKKTSISWIGRVLNAGNKLHFLDNGTNCSSRYQGLKGFQHFK